MPEIKSFLDDRKPFAESRASDSKLLQLDPMETVSKIRDAIEQIPFLGDHPWLMVVFPVCIILLFVWRRYRQKTRADEDPIDELNGVEELLVEEVPDEPVVVDEQKIAHFFLNLYKVQLGASKDASFKLDLLESESTADRKTFELQVLHNKQWAVRRMTVGPLGSETTSRSKCFYVIFDHHLVIKVPQKPIYDIKDYLKTIEADQKIVEKLAPRECIVPTVSAVLKLIHPVATRENATTAEVESKYLNLLRKYPGLNEHLKIENTYMLVMDLSKYYFLSQVIDDFHDLNNKLQQEIEGYPGVVWENHGFEGRYAFENDEQLEAIRSVYTEFENRIAPVLKSAGHDRSIARYTVQKWFLEHLSGRQLQPDEKELNAELVAEINALARKVFKANQDPIENYRSTIRSCIQTVTVSQSKRQLGTLVTNILDLLAWLRDKEIAIRDLKPDNMIIAGDRPRYPEFLSAVNDYTAGLIDVETAIDCSEAGKRKIPQPILGGTPSFATPSHLVKNATLQGLYGHLLRTFYLQDWYAAVGIIYEVVTGETLFRQTGKMIVGIKTAMFKHIDDVETQKDLYKKVSRIFWYSARSELQQKLRIKKDIINTVQVVLSAAAVDMLRQEFVHEKLRVTKKIKRFVAGQSAFKGEKACNSLIATSREKITQLKAKWENQPHEKAEALKVLKGLERMKGKVEKQAQRIQHFEQTPLVLAADELLQILFDVALEAMHRDQWGELMPAEVTGVKAGEETTTIESTV